MDKFEIEEEIDEQLTKKKSRSRVEVPYTIPSWSGAPCHKYFLEESSRFNVYEKGAYMFGRSDTCDFVLDYTSSSLFHAVLQFHRNGDAYIYDLSSRHGTFVNNNLVKKNVYVKLHVGDIIRFGHSSRLYILKGPSDSMPHNMDKNSEPKEEVKEKFDEEQEDKMEKKRQWKAWEAREAIAYQARVDGATAAREKSEAAAKRKAETEKREKQEAKNRKEEKSKLKERLKNYMADARIKWNIDSRVSEAYATAALGRKEAEEWLENELNKFRQDSVRSREAAARARDRAQEADGGAEGRDRAQEADGGAEGRDRAAPAEAEANQRAAANEKEKTGKFHTPQERREKAVDEKKANERRLQKDQEDTESMSADLDDVIRFWAVGNERNLHFLLCNWRKLPWLNCWWKSDINVDRNSYESVKRAYHDALMYIHPDKVPRHVNAKDVCLAKKIFLLVKEAWEIYQSQRRISPNS